MKLHMGDLIHLVVIRLEVVEVVVILMEVEVQVEAEEIILEASLRQTA